MPPPLAVGTGVTILAVIGLVIGLVVFLVVVALLHATLSPLRKILADVQLAKTAPMLERGVPGTDQLGQTRRLAESVPELALAYLQKLGANPAPPAPAVATQAPSGFTPAPASHTPAPAAPTQAPGRPDGEPEQQPAWKNYR